MDEEHYAYILVEDEKWWNRRRSRNMKGSLVHAFVRRGRVGPKQTHRILFYVKLPAKRIQGSGEFLERITGPGDELWNAYGSETVFESKDEYDSFIGGRENVTIIRFKGLEELEKPISSEVIYASMGIRKMPNGGMYVSKERVGSMIKGGL